VLYVAENAVYFLVSLFRVGETENCVAVNKVTRLSVARKNCRTRREMCVVCVFVVRAADQLCSCGRRINAYVRTLLCGLPCKLMAYRSRKLDYVNRTGAQYVFLHEDEGGVETKAPLHTCPCVSCSLILHIRRSILIMLV
jgi:hypothetical protein